MVKTPAGHKAVQADAKYMEGLSL